MKNVFLSRKLFVLWWFGLYKHGEDKLHETDTQMVKKFPTFYGTQSSITVFTTACHWSLS